MFIFSYCNLCLIYDITKNYNKIWNERGWLGQQAAHSREMMIIKNKLYTPLQHTLAQKRVNIKSSSPIASIAKIVNELHVKIFNDDIPLQKISPISTLKIRWRKNQGEGQEDVLCYFKINQPSVSILTNIDFFIFQKKNASH